MTVALPDLGDEVQEFDIGKSDYNKQKLTLGEDETKLTKETNCCTCCASTKTV